MNPSDFTTCAYCPRLCRHVCPVAVGTGFESATPSSMMAVPLLVARGALDAADALVGTSLCLGCGACTAHCKVHVPVSNCLTAWRDVEVPAHEPLAAVVGTALHVCILTDDRDWSAPWAAVAARAVSVLRTRDSLGHASWKRGNPNVLAAVAAHLAGRELVTGSGAVEQVAVAAGLRVHRLPMPPAAAVFHTCHAGPRPGPSQLACCGRREGFAAREPDAARAVALENVRLLGDASTTCVDDECACWLREHGARIMGPTDSFGSFDD